MNLNEQLMEALNDVDDRYIEEAAPGRVKRRPIWPRIAAAAAALAVILTVGLFRLPDEITKLSNTQPNTQEHAGLVQLAQALEEAQITSCAIPTWLPEGCELERIETQQFSDHTETTMVFSYGDQTISITTKTQHDNSSLTIDGALDSEEILGIIQSILWK